MNLEYEIMTFKIVSWQKWRACSHLVYHKCKFDSDCQSASFMSSQERKDLKLVPDLLLAAFYQDINRNQSGETECVF